MQADQLADVIAVGSAVIALGSLAVAFWIGRRQVKQSAEQTALQARVTAIEEARRTEEMEARLRTLVTASFGAIGIRALSNCDRKRPHLFLKNEGSAQVRGGTSKSLRWTRTRGRSKSSGSLTTSLGSPSRTTSEVTCSRTRTRCAQFAWMSAGRTTRVEERRPTQSRCPPG